MTRRLSLTEFLDEFPDDDAFLRLWRNQCDERRKLLRLDGKATDDLDEREMYGLFSIGMHMNPRVSSRLLVTTQTEHLPCPRLRSSTTREAA